MNISARLTAARNILSGAQGLSVEETRIEAQALLRHVLGGVSRAWLIAHEKQTLTREQQSRFEMLLHRRLQGEPVAYILGVREFYGFDFSVTPDVLIPRPDTETLVEAALQRISPDKPCRVLDLGTGSGAIAIAIACHRPQALVTAVDRSAAAICVARSNAGHLLAPSAPEGSARQAGMQIQTERDAKGSDRIRNLRLLQSDWFDALQHEIFDVIVSNPPYIAAADPHLQQGDLRFEPPGALVSGPDGMNDLHTIAAQAATHLAPGGWLLLEHGFDQAERVAGLLRKAGFEQVGHAADLAGIQRVTLGLMQAMPPRHVGHLQDGAGLL
ncbi:release factor glutamine methyltransferase [mine drainage metagenome]|uniref:Release factor glutamine methyltransferase n=1 Tax=mine drainage metagenome TaxID=410659 RepID=A0A1J5Q6F3_9ZZZZ